MKLPVAKYVFLILNISQVSLVTKHTVATSLVALH